MKQTLQNATIIVFLFILVLAGNYSFSQTPDKFSYQAVMRDSEGELVVNSNIGLRIAVVQHNAQGNTVYAETHVVATNDNGLVSVVIGDGIIETGSFDEISWAEGPYFLMTEIDLQGGTQYTLITSNQLLSVPYALYARESGTPATGIDYVEDNEDGSFTMYFTDGSSYTSPDLTGPQGSFPPGENIGEIKYWDGDQWTSIEPGDHGQTLTLCNGVPVWGPCDAPGTATDIDGNVYSTLIIGNQEWMTENLRTTRYRDGSDILTGLPNDQWAETTIGAYAIYPHTGGLTEDDVVGINSPQEMTAAYGKFYNWYAVDDDREICPAGWQVPTNDDWDELIAYVVGQGHPNEGSDPNGTGNALKSCRQVNSPLEGDCDTEVHPRWEASDTHYGLDVFGFHAIPGGYRSPWGSYSSIDMLGSYWSANEGSSNTAWYRVFNGSNGRVYGNDLSKRFGYLVRCVREAR